MTENKSQPNTNGLSRFIKHNYIIIINVIITAILIPLGILLVSLTGKWLGYDLKTWGIISLCALIPIAIALTIKTEWDRNIKTVALEDIQESFRLSSEKVKELETENEKLKAEYEELVNDQLSLIFYKMRLSPTERITVYKHDAENSQFLLLGRYSADPEFNKRSRPTYPDNQGFIMQGWRSGELICPALPDPNSKKGKSYYNAVSAISPIPEHVVKRIRMKSRCFYVRSIRNPASQTPTAVVVVESLKENGLQIETIKALFADGEERRLFSFVEKIAINSIPVNTKWAQDLGL